MKELFKGITTVYNTTNAFKTQTKKRFYLYEAPERVVYPYCVYFMVADENDYTFTTQFDNVLIQFSLFSESEGVSEVSTMFDNLAALYDDATLTVAGYSFIRMVRESANLIKETDPKNIWHYAVTYNVMIER